MLKQETRNAFEQEEKRLRTEAKTQKGLRKISTLFLLGTLLGQPRR